MHSVLYRTMQFLLVLLALAPSIPAFMLDSMIARGDSCVNIVWTPDSANTAPAWYKNCGATCTGSDTVCLRNDFIPGTTYHGIAYSYGGDDPYLVFRDRIGKGVLAGSHLCHYETCSDPSDTVTGIDCSAFNCYAWNEPRQSTGAMNTNPAYEHISRSALAPGDVLVKPGSHSVMVVDQDDSTHFVIQEATGTPYNGCRERLIDITNTYWNSYIPIRNPKITTRIVMPLPSVDGISAGIAGLIHNGVLECKAGSGFDRISVFDILGRRVADFQPPARNGSFVLPSGSFVITAVTTIGTTLTASVSVTR